MSPTVAELQGRICELETALEHALQRLQAAEERQEQELTEALAELVQTPGAPRWSRELLSALSAKSQVASSPRNVRGGHLRLVR